MKYSVRTTLVLSSPFPDANFCTDAAMQGNAPVVKAEEAVVRLDSLDEAVLMLMAMHRKKMDWRDEPGEASF